MFRNELKNTKFGQKNNDDNELKTIKCDKCP
jgi:hypothetical protein